jgi:hypothetical protein
LCYGTKTSTSTTRLTTRTPSSAQQRIVVPCNKLLRIACNLLELLIMLITQVSSDSREHIIWRIPACKQETSMGEALGTR